MLDVDSLQSETQKRSASTWLLALGAGLGSNSIYCLTILTLDTLGLVWASSFFSGTIYFLFWQAPIIIEIIRMQLVQNIIIQYLYYSRPSILTILASSILFIQILLTLSTTLFGNLLPTSGQQPHESICASVAPLASPSQIKIACICLNTSLRCKS